MMNWLMVGCNLITIYFGVSGIRNTMAATKGFNTTATRELMGDEWVDDVVRRNRWFRVGFIFLCLWGAFFLWITIVGWK